MFFKKQHDTETVFLMIAEVGSISRTIEGGGMTSNPVTYKSLHLSVVFCVKRIHFVLFYA